MVRLSFEFSTDITLIDLKTIGQMLQIFSPLDYGDRNTDLSFHGGFLLL
jgi:hypothetical protein